MEALKASRSVNGTDHHLPWACANDLAGYGVSLAIEEDEGLAKLAT